MTMTTSDTAKLFKIINQYYPNFDHLNSERIFAWHELLKEFNLEMLRDAVLEKLSDKNFGYTAPALFDLLHYCRNAVALEKIKNMTLVRKIIEEDNLFIEKQIDSLYCDFYNKTDINLNSYYAPETINFIESIGGWDKIVSSFGNQFNFRYFLNILRPQFILFLKFDEKHKKLRGENNAY